MTGTTTRVYDELNRVISKIVPVIGLKTILYDGEVYNIIAPKSHNLHSRHITKHEQSLHDLQ